MKTRNKCLVFRRVSAAYARVSSFGSDSPPWTKMVLSEFVFREERKLVT
jgi:hypothetical protein